MVVDELAHLLTIIKNHQARETACANPVSSLHCNVIQLHLGQFDPYFCTYMYVYRHIFTVIHVDSLQTIYMLDSAQRVKLTYLRPAFPGGWHHPWLAQENMSIPLPSLVLAWVVS